MCPDRVLRAIDQPTIDHRSREASDLALACMDGMRAVFQTNGHVLIFPGSGTGAWEAALVNTLSAGDRVLAYETGHFSTLWTKVARNLGLVVDYLPGDWRHGADAAAIGAKLADDRDHDIKAVMVVHNETSTGVPARRRGAARDGRRAASGAAPGGYRLVAWDPWIIGMTNGASM